MSMCGIVVLCTMHTIAKAFLATTNIVIGDDDSDSYGANSIFFPSKQHTSEFMYIFVYTIYIYVKCALHAIYT